MKYFSAIFVVLLLISKCEPPENQWFSLRIKNNSLSSISFYQASFESQKLYPDNIISVYKYPDTTITTENITQSTKATFSMDRRKRWEEVVSELSSDTLSIFIFSTAVIEQEGWNKVKDGYLVLKRYDLSIKDLQDLDFVVPYPPTEQMRNIRQYPPFGE